MKKIAFFIGGFFFNPILPVIFIIVSGFILLGSFFLGSPFSNKTKIVYPDIQTCQFVRKTMDNNNQYVVQCGG